MVYGSLCLVLTKKTSISYILSGMYHTLSNLLFAAYSACTNGRRGPSVCREKHCRWPECNRCHGYSALVGIK